MNRSVAFLTIFLLWSSAEAFTAPSTAFHTRERRSVYFPSDSQKIAPRASPSSTSLAGWESFVYNAESLASTWATGTLSDVSFASLPILYGAGLLTSVSPCVWGLLPLTTTYISQATGKDGNILLPTAAFAAGLAAVFCSFGVAAAELGGVFGVGGGATGVILPLLSHMICLLMGFQLLEFIDLPFLQLQGPSSLVGNSPGDEPTLIDATGQILPKEGDKEEQNTLVRTFILGASSGLVASPCATPVLTSILGYCAQVHQAGLSALLLLVYTLGYSTPLLIVAGTGGKALQKLRSTNYGSIGPWVTPLTGGALLYFGTSGILTTVLGEASLAGLPMLQ